MCRRCVPMPASDTLWLLTPWPCIIACLDGLDDECRSAVQASVNLAMETALVRVLLFPNAVPEEVSGWRQLLRAAGERLAQVGEYFHAEGPARVQGHRHAW